MTNIPLSHLAFERGIERITHARQDSQLELPAREQAPPPDAGTQPQLEALLALPTLDDTLDAALRPQLANRQLLVPTHFRQALDDALQGLSQAAQAAADATNADVTNADGASGSDTARVLNRAVRLLKEESALRELLQMYRSALYQG
ncbi:hypothetical protein GCM10027019_13010 [Melaminivora jejuensis]|uniref:type III secretion apparatus assembly protein SctX n=1 Tax=Melaminivora jejuensis TaxID=1267217 RepID=UPI001AE0BA3E|nr:hypothetical protein [Melaminivora jejuensis]UHJ66029.1 hypothetical protein LVC68_05805 [Melaminivora jejuensis]